MFKKSFEANLSVSQSSRHTHASRAFAREVWSFSGTREVPPRTLVYTVILMKMLRGVKLQTDRHNSSDRNYNKTTCFSHFFVDEFGDLWRLVFIINSRHTIAKEYPSSRTDLANDVEAARDMKDYNVARGCEQEAMHTFLRESHEGRAQSKCDVHGTANPVSLRTF